MLLLLQIQEEENTPDSLEQSWSSKYIISQNFSGRFAILWAVLVVKWFQKHKMKQVPNYLESIQTWQRDWQAFLNSDFHSNFANQWM